MKKDLYSPGDLWQLADGNKVIVVSLEKDSDFGILVNSAIYNGPWVSLRTIYRDSALDFSEFLTGAVQIGTAEILLPA